MAGRFDPTEVPDALPPRAARAVLVAGRYRLGPLLGRGGTGTVYAVDDPFGGDRALAIKFVDGRAPGAMRQLRRELTALRLLDLPGVVRMYDDGVDDGQTFLVMDRLPGGTFDRLADRGPWEAWRDRAWALLEVLARVHFAGVVHRDLKPGNVLLDADERPVLTDFGLATGDAVDVDPVLLREGTPRYMAPEQRAGTACDARTDLYAVGVMFAEMLARSGGPPEILAAADRMRAERPEDRFASAVDALAALGARTDALLPGIALPEQADHAALEQLFAEAAPSFRHLATDGAAELLARTGGERDAVHRELERWVRAGLAHWVPDGVRIQRKALEALAWERDPRRAELLSAARDGRRAGAPRSSSPGRPTAAARQAAPWRCSRRWPPTPRTSWPGRSPSCRSPPSSSTASATQPTSPSATSGPTAAACSTPPRRPCTATPPAGTTRSLPSAPCPPPRSRAGGSRSACTPRATPPPARGRLARHRRGLGRRRPGRRSRVASWRARVAYSRGDFAGALAAELEALAGASTPLDRLTRMANGAATALEAPDPALAQELGERALALARELRLGAVECNAAWVLRTAAYQRGAPLPPDPALIAAAAEGLARRRGATRRHRRRDRLAHGRARHRAPPVRRRRVHLRPPPLPRRRRAGAGAERGRGRGARARDGGRDRRLPPDHRRTGAGALRDGRRAARGRPAAGPRRPARAHPQRADGRGVRRGAAPYGKSAPTPSRVNPGAA
ncbi:MAG: protein kinase [Myxococcota bacterium]